MATFLLLIKMSPEVVGDHAKLLAVKKRLDAKSREACPDVTVTTDLALLGPYDSLNLVEAPNQDMAFRFASLMQVTGFAASVEIWTALHFTYPKMKELMIGI